MGKIDLPYCLQDGQKAYAGKVMANLEAIATKINQVNITGMGLVDVESALNRFKVLLDEEGVKTGRVVKNFAYDDDSGELRLELQNGASFVVPLGQMIPNYQGSLGQEISVAIQGDGVISAWLKDGAVSQQKLEQGLQETIAGKVDANHIGNAAEILFADGESFQDKLDHGDFRGKDGVSVVEEGLYYLRVDSEDGHLYVGVADGGAKPPLSINEQGHLIYSID